MRRRLFLAIILSGALLLGLTATAGAHARLLDTYPSDDAHLDLSPKELRLSFSEAVEIGLGGVAVYDHAGTRVDKGDAALDSADATLVHAPLPTLPDGLYTVAYRVISADGHPINGAFGFTVGEGVSGGAYYQPNLPDPDGPPPPLVLVGYWLSVASLMLMFGLPLVRRFVVRGGVDGLLLKWLYCAVGAAFLGTLLFLWGRTAQVTGESLTFALNAGLWGKLLLSSTGLAVLARLLLLVVSLPLLGRVAGTVIGWAPGALGLLTFALGGHAVAVSQPGLGVTADLLHLLAAGAWAGGLVHFALLPVKGAPLSESVRRFGPVALVSFVVLAVTGLYPVLLHVPSWEAFTETLYGQSLMWKLVLVGILAALGAVNFLYTGPRLRKGEEVAPLLRQVSSGEALLLAAILGAAVIMTNSAPARVALPPKVLNVGVHSENYLFVFYMDPIAPGYRTLDVLMYTHDESQIGVESTVYLKARHPGQGIETEVLEGEYVGDHRFRFDNLLLGLPGAWELEATLRRPGAPEETVVYQLELPGVE